MALQECIEPTLLGPLEKKSEPKPPLKSIRLYIALGETTDDYFPYINYEEALGKQLKQIHVEEKDRGQDSSLLEDAFAEEEEAEELVEIARRFEEKYCTSKKRRLRLDDYECLGEGYDESDSFIDNAEAFEEAVPDELSPALGGFYINKGDLESKTNNDLFLLQRKETSVVTSDDENYGGISFHLLPSVGTGGETSSISTSKKKKEKNHRDDERKEKAKKEMRTEVPNVHESNGTLVADTIERVILAGRNNELSTPKFKNKGGANALADGVDVQIAVKVKKEVKGNSCEPYKKRCEFSTGCNLR